MAVLYTERSRPHDGAAPSNCSSCGAAFSSGLTGSECGSCGAYHCWDCHNLYATARCDPGWPHARPEDRDTYLTAYAEWLMQGSPPFPLIPGAGHVKDLETASLRLLRVFAHHAYRLNLEREWNVVMGLLLHKFPEREHK